MFENFSSLSRSDRDMAQDLLAELIPRQRPPVDDQPPKFRGPGPGGGYPGPADADLK
ncbi:CdiI immunity protein domain-containing protein [Kibdelosporangium persicum]